MFKKVMFTLEVYYASYTYLHIKQVGPYSVILNIRHHYFLKTKNIIYK